MGEDKRKEEFKAELFAKEPEKFVHLEDLVFAVMEDESGIKHFCNLKRTNRFQQAIGIAIYELPQALNYFLMTRRKEKNIVTP